MAKTVPTRSRDVEDLTAAAISALTRTTVLECLGRQPGPPSLGADLAHALDLPPTVLGDLWSVLEPNLGAINTPHTAEAVGGFCAKHGLDPRAVTPVIGALRFLLHRSAERDLAPDLVEADVRLLLASAAPDEAALGRVLDATAACYRLAVGKLRRRAVHEALTDHGRVVTDVKWRVDNVSHANTGEAIHVPVTLLTLRYREGEQVGQVTVQLLPDELRKLQQACEQALR